MGQGNKRWATGLVAAGLFVVGGVTGTAQDATPSASGHLHPAHIHLGSCQELDPNPTYMLTDLALPTGASDAATDGATAIPVERSTTTVDDTIENLRTGGYAINIHQSVDDIGVYIACGNLTGAIDDGGVLVVGLGELNGSAHTGIAILTENGVQTGVNLYLAEGLSGAAAAASAGTAGGVADTVDAVKVDIKDFAYNPTKLEIPVGATVTWTNSDTVPHTATAQNRESLQTGTLNAGDSASQTFTTPGAIDYFCEFHANMKGSIVVK